MTVRLTLTSYPILRYGILDALIASVGGVSLDVLANDYQESLNKAAGPPYQQDDSNNKRSSLDSNPFSLAATLASICDVLCMPRCFACPIGQPRRLTKLKKSIRR